MVFITGDGLVVVARPVHTPFGIAGCMFRQREEEECAQTQH
jgi:hypothetical protein